ARAITRPRMPRTLAEPVYRFAPPTLDAGHLPAIEPLFQDLLQRDVRDTEALERWLFDESELLARIAAEQARRYIAMTCHTDDAAARERYLAMEREVMPRVKVLADQLDRKFLQSPALPSLDPDRYRVLVRRRRTASEIFREENTPLQTEESELQTRQQSLMGAIVVPFEGRDHTLQQMAPYQEDQ